MAEVDASIKVEVREELKEALHDNALLFSGFKAYHTMREAGLTLQDKKTGGIKSFEVFRKEAEKIFKKQGLNLRAEYQHAVMTAQMATKWQEIVEDKDRYDLQYRTAGDDRVRKEHSVLNGVTLPVDDRFWAEFYPPNGWGCRCQAVQVRKGKYPHSDSKQAILNGYEMTSKPSQKIFRTNAGQTKKVFPDKHPNFPKGCGECPVKGGQTKLYYDKDSDVCRACKIVTNIIEQNKTDEKRKQKYIKSSLEEYNHINEYTHIRTYFNYETGGYIVTERGRKPKGYDEAIKSDKLNELKKNDQLRIYKKEYDACLWLADKGYRIIHRKGEDKGDSYDITINGLKADLKQVESLKGLENHMEKALKEQGAEIVIFIFNEKLKRKHHSAISKIRKIERAHGLFFSLKGKTLYRY